ncbi:MAG: OmpA/MotB domain protein [Sphingobacteriaceae bacterium]|jgi:outer membrane protein OmpA-like peptidoglycan-associated protein/tetratricopeptide (TPR) repeat protein|nr:OmpA/MotB domain protein [Sphingobacteriaceae bacterium]
MKFLLALVFSFCAIQSSAQKSIQSKNKSAQRAYEQAGQSLSLNFYDQAIEQLKDAIKNDSEFAAAYQQLGDVYRKKQDYASAKPNYLKVLSIDPEFYPGTYLGLGESELNTGDYQNALQHFTKYLAYSNISDASKKLVSKYVKDCQFSIEAIKKPVPFKPENLGASVNTKDQEYLPVVTADEETLIFTRRKNNMEDFYKSVKVDNQWSNSQYLSKDINTDIYNEGAQCISPDGLYLFFTGCNRPDGMGRCDIYVSRREGKGWSKPFNLGAPVNTPGWESQPTLSADGRILYFTSTRPGGLGGYDIYRTELKEGGAWKVPVNLGPLINTAYDEQSPFIHPDGQTLYFSSNGWPGFGSRDIYISRKDANGNWQKAENLGYPINSYAEEAGLTLSSNGKKAFFSADKPGGQGGLDIYSFDMPENLRPKPVTYVKGATFDKKTKELVGAEIKITNLADGSLIYDDSSDEETGQFLATMPAGKKYGLTIKKEGYLFYSQNFTLDKPASITKPYLLNVPLEQIEVGAMAVLNNVFFETNKFTLLPESKVELQQLISFLNTNPKASIEISGHTDNVGDDKANQLLSQNRAKEVYNFLSANKIPPARLVYKGYGETQPIADNSTEEGRQMNRRTEFKIFRIAL